MIVCYVGGPVLIGMMIVNVMLMMDMAQQSQGGLTMLSRHSVGTHQGNELTCSSWGNTEYISLILF